jgi:hypothetical protein
MELNNLLMDLSKELKAKGFQSELMFNTGVNEHYLYQVMGEEKILLYKDLIDLYAWHNGSPMSEGTIGDVSLFCGNIFVPFEYSWLSYRYFKSEQFFIDRYHQFPFMQDGSGVVLFIDGSESSVTKNMLYEYDISRFPGPYQLKFESISTLISGTLECLTRNVYTRNAKGQIDVEFEKERKIFQKHNPSVPFWRN